MGVGNNKIQHRVNFINHPGYELFKAKYPDTAITYAQYIAVLKTTTTTIRDHILNNQLGFKLPHLGYIAVDRFKPKASCTAVDWIATRRLGKRIPLTNLHSFGYMYKVKFYPNPRINPLRNYTFKAHRLLNRMIKPLVVKDSDHFIHVDRNYFSKRFKIDNYLTSN